MQIKISNAIPLGNGIFYLCADSAQFLLLWHENQRLCVSTAYVGKSMQCSWHEHCILSFSWHASLHRLKFRCHSDAHRADGFGRLLEHSWSVGGRKFGWAWFLGKRWEQYELVTKPKTGAVHPPTCGFLHLLLCQWATCFYGGPWECEWTWAVRTICSPSLL